MEKKKGDQGNIPFEQRAFPKISKTLKPMPEWILLFKRPCLRWRKSGT
jgi:hypothetical protein